jgi:hypothetical protein
MVVFVAADGFAGAALEVGKAVESVPAQRGVHGRGGQAELVGDRDWAQTSFPAQVHDLADGRGRGQRRLPVRP